MTTTANDRVTILERLCAAGDALLDRVLPLLDKGDGPAKFARVIEKHRSSPKASGDERVLPFLVAAIVELLDKAPPLLQDTSAGGALAGEIDAYIDDVREYMVSLVKTKWAPGEAPPGIEEIQSELKEVEREERRKARNKSKASARKGSTRKAN